MAQTKKIELRDAIMRSAFKLFAKQGYSATTIAAIARAAGVSEANLYVYFPSKLAVFMGLYQPWLMARIDALERRVAAQRSARAKLRSVLEMLWCELPSADDGFSTNLIQALSLGGRREGYRPLLLYRVEARIEALLRAAIPGYDRRWPIARELPHILMMAQDGFVMNYRLSPRSRCTPRMIERACDLILGMGPASASAAKSKTRPRAPSGRARVRG